LDDNLQIQFERYLEERGINSAMAVFAVDYIDSKESQEYLQWLKSELPKKTTAGSANEDQI
jgi:complement component 1 Q subcomponent-binding protein